MVPAAAAKVANHIVSSSGKTVSEVTAATAKSDENSSKAASFSKEGGLSIDQKIVEADTKDIDFSAGHKEVIISHCTGFLKKGSRVTRQGRLPVSIKEEAVSSQVAVFLSEDEQVVQETNYFCNDSEENQFY